MDELDEEEAKIDRETLHHPSKTFRGSVAINGLKVNCECDDKNSKNSSSTTSSSTKITAANGQNTSTTTTTTTTTTHHHHHYHHNNASSSSSSSSRSSSANSPPSPPASSSSSSSSSGEGSSSSSSTTSASKDGTAFKGHASSSGCPHHLEAILERQERFQRTVVAISNIVGKKLYRYKVSNLEAYFKEVFHISRAQVYRFLDCVLVLKVS
ncbi:hypothetical protein BC829DRAFT_165159 [Chytridium lagenaria]|nr:hypothetical protein BC829DRAFT_165159 [Chytridium lagenaria]